jgi:Alkylmercury lyase
MDDEDIRLAVYHSFATTGAPPAYDELASRLGGTYDDVVRGISRLADQRHVVVDEARRIVMAHPFASIPLGFSVMGRNTLWWGGCSWDSFAIPHLLTDEPDVLVATKCPGCDRPGAWVVDRKGPPDSSWLAHFLVPVSRMWDDVVHTCSNQRLFCSERCIDDWLERGSHQRGYVMDVETLWRLAAGWYQGRLDRGYVRREPAAASEYLRSVGLADPFWGTG